jgi:hypothetical protein
MGEDQTERDLTQQEEAETLAKAAVRESARAINCVLTRTRDPEAIDRALGALTVAHAMGADDRAAEALASKLLIQAWNLARSVGSVKDDPAHERRARRQGG